MKKFVLALALVLGLAGSAMADQTHQCTAGDGQKFTIAVPEGWTAQDIEGGCAVAKADGSEFISVAYYQTSLNAKAFAEDLARKMNVTPEINEQEDGYVDFDAVVNGVKLNITITADGTDGEAQVTTQKGESELLEKIFDSVAF